MCKCLWIARPEGLSCSFYDLFATIYTCIKDVNVKLIHYHSQSFIRMLNFGKRKKKEKNLEIATIRRQETYVGPLKLAWWPRIIIWFSVHRRQTLFLSLPQWNSDEQKPRHLHLKEVFVSIFLPSAYTSFQFYMHFKGKIFNMDHQYHHHYRHLPQMY